MTVQRQMGFEFGDEVELAYGSTTEFFPVAGTATCSTAQRHRRTGGIPDPAGCGGDRSLRLQAGDEVSLFTYTGGTPLMELAFAAYLVAGKLEVRFRDDAHTTTQCAFTFDAADGKVRVYRGTSAGTLLATSAGAPVTLSTWLWVHVAVTAENVGQMVVSVEGAMAVDTGAADLQPGAFADFDVTRFVGGTGCDCYLDDVLFADPGDLDPAAPLFEVTGIPSSNATVQGTPTGGTNYATAAEGPPPDTATFVTFTDSQQDLYGTTGVGYTGCSVLSVRVAGYAEGEGAVDVWTPVLSSGGTASRGSYTAEATWTPAQLMFPTDPDGDVPWTLVKANAALAGVQMGESGGGGLG